MAQLAIGINYDVAGTVDELMQKQLQYMRLNQMQAAKNVKSMQSNAYTSLQSLITDFQTQLTNLGNAFNTIAYQATSSDSTIVSGLNVISNVVGSGSHNVVVTQLAKAQKYLSGNQFSSSTNALNVTETMTFTNNTDSQQTFTVDVVAGDTLENIRDKINNASGDMGVNAAIVSSTSGGLPVYNLVLTAKTGTTNAFTVTGDTAFSFNQATAAADALFSFDGLSVVRSSNVINDVMDGLNFTLSGLGSATINVTNLDGNNAVDAVQTAIQNMLTSYNKIITFLDGNQKITYYDDKNKIRSSSYNDAFSFIKSRIQSAMNTIFGGTGDIQSINAIGIKNSPAQVLKVVKDDVVGDVEINSFGSLMIDTTTQSQYGGDTLLQYKLKNDFNAVKDFFSNSTSGLIFNLNNVIDNSINASAIDNGIIATATASLDQMKKTADTQIDNEKKRLSDVRDGLITQFTYLNAIISSYQNISDYLDKQTEYLGSLLKGRK